ncbi:MAG: EF-P lysine aminoacylase EpmA [Victivallaceae bacterium]
MSNVSAKPDSVFLLEQNKTRLLRRAGLIAAVRQYFDSNGFAEVETPLMIKAPAPEEFIEAPQAGEMFLRTSPELQMKLMLAAGFEKIYQIGACFREGEFGRKHRPEFTMLEWYQTGADYMDLLNFTTGMLRRLAQFTNGYHTISYQGRTLDFPADPEIITVKEAFRRFAGTTPEAAMEADQFDELMVARIEPELGKGRPTFLKDYPASRSALARLNKNDSSVAERWELYLDGIEIANAYSELIDPAEQEVRFKEAAAIRARNGLRKYPPPTEFMQAIRAGMPESSGCALGIDRLIMIFTDADDISQVKSPAS